MKSNTMFVCQECGYESTQWLGKCPECGTWNSLKEFQVKSKITRSARSGQILKIGGRREELKPRRLDEIAYREKARIKTGFSEMDGVLGGGIVSGSVVLLAGDPGIGKSTLLLQTALNVARGPAPTFPPTSTPSKVFLRNNSVRAVGSPSSRVTPRLLKPVLYISGEESEEQIKLRAERIVDSSKNKNLLLLSTTDTDAIYQIIEEIKPSLVIIDSIQTMESENLEGLAGSVAQVRYAAFSFIKLAKSLNIPVILIGHVTKEGMVAGPMILSHMVDVVLFLEGEKTTGTRILRGLKNRFGPIDEVGIFALESKGMKEIKNPEEIFLASSLGKKAKSVPGSVLVAIMEGTRPFLIELQALVIFSKLPVPRHVASGIDNRRLELLLAVLQRHCNLLLSPMDVFVNVAGGLKVLDPGVDLGICLAVFSSLKNISLSDTVAIAEVGLLGELRNVPSLDKRIKQAKKLGFNKIISANTHRYLSEAIEELGKSYGKNQKPTQA